jgi:hypothetical protein
MQAAVPQSLRENTGPALSQIERACEAETSLDGAASIWSLVNQIGIPATPKEIRPTKTGNFRSRMAVDRGAERSD